jgi:pteridine reductase
MNLEGKVALVTGGARRVGRAVAWSLAQAGCDVAITYRKSVEDAHRLVEAIRGTGRRAWAIAADLTQPKCIAGLRSELLTSTGRLDILVHNASQFMATPWGTLTADQCHDLLAIHAVSPLLLTQALRDELAADEGGRIVHFLDVHLLGRTRAGYAAYNASKAALLELTYTLARELAPHITVNAVAPGVVDWARDMSEQQKAEYLQRVPLGRAGTPRDAADAVLYLVRDADYVTGQVLRVDGGRWLE